MCVWHDRAFSTVWLQLVAESGAEVAGSESRADVAPKDESVSIVADPDDELRRRLEELRIKAKARQIGDLHALLFSQDKCKLCCSTAAAQTCDYFTTVKAC